MRSDLFSPDVQEFLRCLAKHQVRYLLIGGTAVIYHGYASLTGDVDFLYDCEAANCARLWDALLEFWGGAVPAVTGASELTNPKLVVQFGRPPNRIDLIASLKTVDFAQAWSRRVRETIEGKVGQVEVNLVGLADLRRSKQEAGRPKDLDDLRHLPPS